MDTDLVIRAQNGDQAAFTRLAEAMVDRLLSVAQGILSDTSLAEDATQQALVNIWRDLPRLRDAARFEAWSYRLLVNACYTEVRRARRWMPNVAVLPSDQLAAADDVAAVADRDELERGFRRLSIDQRAVVVLHHYRGLSLDEVADALGVPVGTAHSRLHRAMGALRAALDADARPVAIERASQEVPR